MKKCFPINRFKSLSWCMVTDNKRPTLRPVIAGFRNLIKLKTRAVPIVLSVVIKTK